jgi:NTE family protein
MSPPAPRSVGVVLAGAGARGAYEAGVLSVVLPAMAEAGVRPELYVGTSAGAINAALFTATAHLPAEEQADTVLETWRGISSGDVYRSFLRTGPTTLAQWATQLLGLPGHRLVGLLDTGPLHATAARLLDWDRLRSNVDDGVASIAVVTTAAASDRTVVFVDRPGVVALPKTDVGRGIDYVAARVTAEHVLASAAIPVAFPPVRVTAPASAAGWYFDGGVRLNTPLKPALALGAEALVVVATHPSSLPEGPPALDASAEPPPDVDDVLVRVMDAALVDRMVEDVHTLARTNELVASGGRRRRGRRRLTVVPYLFVGPLERRTLGEVAARCYDDRYRGVHGALRRAREIDQRLLGRFLGGDGDRRGDLLSYLQFEDGFMSAAIDLGRADAARTVAATDPGDLPWCRAEPLDVTASRGTSARP